MFVQIIEGTASDAEGLIRQGERWQQELGPGAAGFLGVTSGVAPDGRAITIVRFESEAAARAQSDRPEQGAWWSETEKCYAGSVSFTESSDVAEFLGGGSNTAGFVQVMKVQDVDRAKVDRLDAEFEKVAARLRPDLLGGVRVWTGPTSYVEAMYFTSESEARAAEEAGPPEELQQLMAEFGELMANTEFIDLPNPQLH
ncbi:MAG: hypothetical protein WD691_04355 [Acidimicrobiales bacterium]